MKEHDMPVWVWIVIAAAVVIAAVVIVAAAAASSRRKTQRLKERFGPEYDRSVTMAGDQREAERDLRDKAARRDELDIRPLGVDARAPLTTTLARS